MTTETHINRNRVCEGYTGDSKAQFILNTVKAGGRIDTANHDFNNLLVVLEGRLMAGYNEHRDIELGKDEMIFLPAYSVTRIQAVTDAKVMVGTFNFPSDAYSSRTMQSLWELRLRTQFYFSSVPVKPVLKQYLDLLARYLNDGLQCDRLHEVKEKEIFMIFMWYYSDQEFVRLFYPIIVKSLDFRTMVMKNYTKAKSVSELAYMVGMSRSKFDYKFREEFGMSAKEFMQERMAAKIRYYMTKPGVTVKDIMTQCGFSSFTQFYRFCKKQFGESPSEIMRKQLGA